ncbi:GntR family transcriptional regulator [Beijerinckia sp. L45]|uniref:GntR family transcriptional regulator n=1 Tax=Beijerinckia sp. L45 TaxID=1641855 RepID=UPI00131BBA1B|nr:FCD domain-containing protein [Beijerinckia sp. L45]
MTNISQKSGLLDERDSPTIATTTQNRLRADIVDLTLKPGQTLRFDWLREKYQVSLSPLREALMRLIAEGLVLLEDHRGFRVAPVSTEHLLDLTMVRSEMEALAISLSIEKGDEHWESFVLASLNTLSKYPGKNGRELFDPEYEKRHRTFHYSLYAACGSPILLATLAQFNNQWARYRLLSGRYMSRGRNIAREHEDLKKAVLARNAETATRLIQRHISASADSILTSSEPIFDNSTEIWP